MTTELLARNIVLIVVLLALILQAYLYAVGRQVSEEPGGRVLFLVGAFLLPLLALGGGIARSFDSATRTEFCLSCHEMAPFGEGLEVDDRHSIMTVHYQNNLIPRDHACYSCHKDYGMFGDVRAKLRGLDHLVTHYARDVRGGIALEAPFDTQNCLDCHARARRYIEAPAHKLATRGEGAPAPACLGGGCHGSAHPVLVEGRPAWRPGADTP